MAEANLRYTAEQINKKLDRIEISKDSVDPTLDSVDRDIVSRLDGIETGLGEVETKIDEVETDISGINTTLGKKLDIKKNTTQRLQIYAQGADDTPTLVVASINDAIANSLVQRSSSGYICANDYRLNKQGGGYQSISDMIGDGAANFNSLEVSATNEEGKQTNLVVDKGGLTVSSPSIVFELNEED